MRWFGVTIALLVASALLVIGIYVRDRHISNWRPSQAALAHHDAAVVLSALEGYHCHRGCSFKVLGHSRGSDWLARIRVRSDSRCFDIDVRAFAFSAQQGLSGIEQISCSTAAGSPTT